jgi:sulfur relay (sulfurtransferase) DsrF/TusC family protein
MICMILDLNAIFVVMAQHLSEGVIVIDDAHIVTHKKDHQSMVSCNNRTNNFSTSYKLMK